jgi:hypothetical protein
LQLHKPKPHFCKLATQPELIFAKFIKVKAFLIVTLLLQIYSGRAQEESPRKKFFLEFNSGYSYLLGSRDTGYSSRQLPITYDRYSNFGHLGVALYFSPKKLVESKGADLSVGIGFDQWVYTVKRNYYGYYSSAKVVYSGEKNLTESNIFTIFRSQLLLNFLWAFNHRTDLNGNIRIGLGCLLPKTSTEKSHDYVAYSYSYATQQGSNDTIHSKDFYHEDWGFSLTVSAPLTYRINKNALVFFEPGLTFSEMKMDYKAFNGLVDGIGIFTDLKLGLRYHF